MGAEHGESRHQSDTRRERRVVFPVRGAAANYREAMTYAEWTDDDTRAQIAVPLASDDKYSRGVLGVITGSSDYPGAAVLGVEAALRTGVGMLRYLGPGRATRLVLQRRPEVVTKAGRVQAWLIGSGQDEGTRDDATATRLSEALADGLPTVIDAGALDLLDTATGPVIVTPHYGELARVLSAAKSDIAADPATWAVRAAEKLGATVLLKGANTYIADPHGARFVVRSSVFWTATAGSGDALAGILGALVSTHSDQVRADAGQLAFLAAAAASLHTAAARRASGGGPFVVLDLATAVSAVVREMLAGAP